MTKVIKFLGSYTKIFLFIIALVISTLVINKSLFLRWIGYERIPIPLTDEFDYAWLGLSLRTNGVPLAWTTYTHIYKDPNLHTRGGNLKGFGITSDGKNINLGEFKKDPRPVVAIEEIDYMKGKEHMFFAVPYFEHPPLGSIIYSLGVGKDITDFGHVKPDSFRKPALTLAIITAILLFIFLFQLTLNPWIASLGVIIYSTVPTYLLATRTAFLENAVPPFILIHLIILYFAIKVYKKDLDRKKLLILLSIGGLVGGLAVLAKEPAIGFLFGSFILLVINKIPKKNIAIFTIMASLPILGFISWGLWLQKDIFLAVFFSNATRGFFGSIKFITILESLRFKNYPFDGWWIWGFISFFLVSIYIKHKQTLYLVIPLFTHLLLLLLLSSPNYPWYTMSMIPFLAACSALLIWEIYEKPNIATSYAFFFIPFSSSYYWGGIASKIPPNVGQYRLIFLLFTLLLIVRLFLGKYKVIRYLWFIFLALLIYRIIILNERSLLYFIENWGNLSIPSPVTF